MSMTKLVLALAYTLTGSPLPVPAGTMAALPITPPLGSFRVAATGSAEPVG